MMPGQVWWLVEAKMPKAARRDDEEMRELVRMVKEAKAKEAAANG